MSDEFRLSELDRLFQQAIELPASGRRDFLDRICGGRPALQAELRRLLEAHADAGAFLDCSLPSYLNAVRSGTHIGRWKLVEPIGEGGLGVVYRGSCEADGVTIHAAVKILRAGFHKGVFQERFIQERAILSGLDHPYIARLIDAGADSCGDSFLAVEFVNGRSLDRYCQETDVSLPERLNIFVKICEAVEYLHSNRIVHGDIKPANVMVKQDATPKLLDFGTARLIDAGNPESSARFSRLIMTPGYASPEQMAGLGPSVPGDVYSLGCVLGDMLADVTSGADLAAVRDRCLSHSKAGRYSSPREIAADVQRYLTHFPVRAYSGSGWYVTSKFIRRNRTGSVLATVATLSLLAASLLSWYGARRADLFASRHRSAISRLVGEPTFVQTPESNQRIALTGSIQDAISHLEEMKPQPLAELAGAWRRLSYIQAVRGQTQQGIESLQHSIEYARRNFASQDSPATRAALADSLLYAAFLNNRRGSAEKAGVHAVEAIRLIEALPAQDRIGVQQKPQFLYALFSAARRMAQSGNVQGGRDLLIQGLDKSRSLNKTLQLRLLLDLAVFERRAGNSDRAESYCKEAKSLDLAANRLRNVCKQSVEPTDAGKRESALLQEMTLLEKRLVLDPENFGDRRQLARLKLQLARHVAASGDNARAGRLVEEARLLAKALIEADPENHRLLNLRRNIERGLKQIRGQTHKSPNYD